MPTLVLPFGSGLDRYSGIADVRPGTMADLRNVRTRKGKVQARKGMLLRATLPDQAPSDQVVNGDFSTDSDWTQGTNWQISGGVASQSAPSASDLSQDLVLVEGQTYEVVFDVANRTAGSITAKVGGTSGTVRSSNGTFTEQIVAGADGKLTFSADGTWDGDIDNVTCTLILGTTPTCSSVPLVHAVQSQQEGVAVGYYAASREVHVYRTGATGVDPIHLGRWFVLPVDAASPPTFTAAESYAKAFLAHEEVRQGKRAPTQVYDALAGTLTTLTADLDGTGAAPVSYRGVVNWRNYMLGWGFGHQTEVRPEYVRISLPGQPDVFEPDHYFIAGDRGSAVVSVREAGAGLVVLKGSSTYEIVGTSHLNFGILPLYALQGVAGARLAITIDRTCYAWGLEGPWATTVSDNGDLEPPLDLEGPAPAGLPSASDTREGFAVYVPAERIIEWHFGSRIYALSIEPTEGAKWSYRTRPVAAASGGLLYSGGEVLADSPDVAPTGNATITQAVVASGTTATVEWNNVSQDGDETLELWLKPDGGEWAQDPPDTAVTLAGTQQRGVTDLEIGLGYTVAVRYRRGGQYHDDYASPNPDDWPATSRATFTPTPVAPTLDAVTWSRVSSSVEKAVVAFTPAADHETVAHKVFRDTVEIVELPAGTLTYDDTGVTGETDHDYVVRAVAHGNESVDSNQITAYMGPPAPSNVQYTDLGTGGCDPGETPHQLTWSNGDATLPTEVHREFSLESTRPAGDTSYSLCAETASPDLQVRHKKTTFGTDDFSKLITAVPA